MVFYGTNGKSEPVSLDRKGDQAKNHKTYDVNECVHSNLFLILMKLKEYRTDCLHLFISSTV